MFDCHLEVPLGSQYIRAKALIHNCILQVLCSHRFSAVVWFRLLIPAMHMVSHTFAGRACTCICHEYQSGLTSFISCPYYLHLMYMQKQLIGLSPAAFFILTISRKQHNYSVHERVPICYRKTEKALLRPSLKVQKQFITIKKQFLQDNTGKQNTKPSKLHSFFNLTLTQPPSYLGQLISVPFADFLQIGKIRHPQVHCLSF